MKTMAISSLEHVIQRIHNSEKLIWVFCGDSITQGNLHTAGKRSYVELFAERVRYELKRKEDIIINSGVAGSITDDLLAGLEHRVLQFRPEIVSLMIGMNDAAKMSPQRFEHNLIEILRQIKNQTKAEAIIQTCCAVDPADCPERRRYPDLMETCRRVAEDMEVALIDHHAAWEVVRKTDEAAFRSWMSNRFHPNALGHWVLADRMLHALELGSLEHASPPRGAAHVSR